MKNKVIIPIFVVLLLLAMVPLSFDSGSMRLLFGWLPLQLAYWWILMFVNLTFVLCVARHFVKTSKKEGEGDE
ncbi:MAG: hypothetical protein FWD91_07415 [Treponema sp.]|nr:hypothetical protein [Treponema sp.]